MAHCFKLAIAQCVVLAEETHQATEVASVQSKFLGGGGRGGGWGGR